MAKWCTTVGLRTLAGLYLGSASVFGFAAALQAGQSWAVGVKDVAAASGPATVRTAEWIRDEGIKPAWAFTLWSVEQGRRQVAAWTAKPEPEAPKPIHFAKKTPVQPPPPVLRHAEPPALERTLAPALAPVEPQAGAAGSVPDIQLAQTETPELMPAPDNTPPSPGEVKRVLAHLKVSLTKELYENFALFLYVSKASHGPWQQRMFVFAKENSGNLKLRYAFPVSTGKEVPTVGPTGKLLQTHTEPGFYQLDPDRMYKRYTSHQWKHPMPYAMFFNWEHGGLRTGLAIHSAVGDDIQLLGSRASAGCVRLDPQNAELLYRLVRSNYRGLTPRFAYDARTATMSNEGLLMHDKAGNLQYQEGYKVLVMIENNGGDDVIAALF